MTTDGPLKITARLRCGDDFAIGPGKAAVLEAIAEHGSISAAARALGMSYRRAWMLVDSMNRCWDRPLVDASAGGRSGSRLTARGQEVLDLYRAMEARIMAAATAGDGARLLAHLRPEPRTDADPD